MPTTDENFLLILKLAKTTIALKAALSHLANETKNLDNPDIKAALDSANEAVEEFLEQMEKT